MDNSSELLIYQTSDGKTKIEVQLQDETVWLSLNQMSELFQKVKSTISEHIKHIYEEAELQEISTVRKFRTVQQEDERLKSGNQINYFDELLERIRDIRSSEKIFYQKVKDIYALSIDYETKSDQTKDFFATIQNKLHWAIHQHTAAEIIVERVNADKQNLGLSSWKSEKIRKSDVTNSQELFNRR